MIDINYINDQDKIDLPEGIEEVLESVVLETLNHESIDKFCEISVLFVDNEKIRILNRDYRENDKETDVLSFPQYENIEEINDEGDFIPLGDVVISLERALEQSKEYGHSFLREVSYLTVHSILHLLGYDHMDDEEKKNMRNKEEIILDKLETEGKMDRCILISARAIQLFDERGKIRRNMAIDDTNTIKKLFQNRLNR